MSDGGLSVHDAVIVGTAVASVIVLKFDLVWLRRRLLRHIRADKRSFKKVDQRMARLEHINSRLLPNRRD